MSLALPEPRARVVARRPPWVFGLHGNVPGHQLDWIHRPDPGRAGLRSNQLAQLLALIRDHDVPSPARPTLTLGNLSRGMPKQGPGRDVLGMTAHFRVASRLDHGGRLNPRFVAAAVFAGEGLSARGLDAAVEQVMAVTGARADGGDRAADRWYGRYVDALEERGEATALVRELLDALRSPERDLSGPQEEGWGPREGAPLPARLVVLCEDELSPEATRFMAEVAHMLSRSTLRWHSVTTCRAVRHLQTGLVVQVLPERARIPRDQVSARLSQLGADPVEAARALLQLVPRRPERYVPVSTFSRDAFALTDPSEPSAPRAAPLTASSTAPRRAALEVSPEQLLADARFAALIEDAGEPEAAEERGARLPAWTWASALLFLLFVLGLGWFVSAVGQAEPARGEGAERAAVSALDLGGAGRVEEVEEAPTAPLEAAESPQGPAPAASGGEEAPAPAGSEGEEARAPAASAGDATPPPAASAGEVGRGRGPATQAPERAVAEVTAAPPILRVTERAPAPAWVEVEATGERVELRGSEGARQLRGSGEVPPGRYSVWVRFAEDGEWVSHGALELEPASQAAIRCAMWRCRVEGAP